MSTRLVRTQFSPPIRTEPMEAASNRGATWRGRTGLGGGTRCFLAFNDFAVKDPNLDANDTMDSSGGFVAVVNISA